MSPPCNYLRNHLRNHLCNQLQTAERLGHFDFDGLDDNDSLSEEEDDYETPINSVRNHHVSTT